MSAWLVSKAHIDTLVQSSIVAGLAEMTSADALGEALWRENHLSLNARYGDSMPESIDYVFSGVEAPLDSRVVRGAIHSWEYQSCEHGEAFTQSQAFRLMLELDTMLDDGTEFDGKGWRIDDITQAIKEA